MPEDLTREMNKIRTTVGFDAVNSLARGAMQGCRCAMGFPQVLAAACGSGAALDALPPERNGAALRAAAGGGFRVAVASLLARGVSPDSPSGGQCTPLHDACTGGHVGTWVRGFEV